MTTSLIRLETRKVNIKIEELAKEVIAIHKKAAKAVEKMDLDISNQVLDDKRTLNVKYLDIEADLEFLITKAPVDKDLRRTLAFLSISKELERISDYARNLAKFILYYRGELAASSIRRISEVHALVISSLEQLQKVIKAEDFDKSLELAKKDKNIDCKVAEVRNSIIRSISSKESLDDIDQRVFVLNIITRLERAGDHIVNICESIVYISNGQHVMLD